MKNNSIEDIYIGGSDSNKKKGKKGIIIILLLLVLILIGMIVAYFYFSNSVVTEKQAFITGLSNVNINQLAGNDIYNEISKRMLEENSETATNINFSATKVPEELEEIDVSNFEFNLVNNNNIDESKSYAELGLNYSGNEIFKVKLLATSEEVGIASDEIVTRYVGLHYDKINEVFGVDFDKEDINKISKIDKIDLTQEERSNYAQKYLSKIFEQIPEEKFTKQDNIAIEKDGTSVSVVSHNVTLTQDELKNVLVNTLTELKNDDELLKKLVTGSESNVVKDESQSEQNTTSEPIPMPTLENTSTINIHDETNSSEEQLTSEEGTENNFNSSMTIEENSESQLEVTPTEEIDLHNTVSEVEDEISDLAITSEDNDTASDAIYNLTYIMLGRKANTTTQNIKSQIEDLIKKVENMEGNGLTINLYTSDEATEKISLILPNANTLDIEFTKKSENDNSIKITYLFEEKEENVSKEESEEGVITYSAEDEINSSTDTNGATKKNGIELSINNISNEASNTLKINCNIIEKESINQKIELELKTEGSKASNEFKNNVILGIKTKESEYKVLLDNNVKFDTKSEIEDLTNENCVFLDELSEEERSATLMAILEKINSVFNEKKENLSFFDTNTNSSIIQQDLQTASSTVSKEEAKEALINKFKSLYQEAQDNGQEFTLHNLENLEIEGFEVSSNITDESAVIVVDTYTFRINSNFELSEE